MSCRNFHYPPCPAGIVSKELPLPTLVLQDRAPEGLIPAPSPEQPRAGSGTGIFVPAAPGALWEPWQPRAVQGAALPTDPWGTGSLGTLHRPQLNTGQLQSRQIRALCSQHTQPSDPSPFIPGWFFSNFLGVWTEPGPNGAAGRAEERLMMLLVVFSNCIPRNVCLQGQLHFFPVPVTKCASWVVFLLNGALYSCRHYLVGTQTLPRF